MPVWQSIDETLFRFINQKLANPVFDVVMPFLSGNALFIPAVVILVLLLLWRGGCRGRVYVLMVGVLVGVGDPLVCNSLKHYFARPRPFITLPDARRPGQGPVPATTEPIPPNPNRARNSMPSAHAFNWGALTIITMIYYRRSWRFIIPLALAVSFSRIYNGVHYPSDVLAGLLLGAIYAFSGVVTLNALWNSAGKSFSPPDTAACPISRYLNGTPAVTRVEFSVSDYDLALTLTCGQAFRWRPMGDAWEGVIHGRWVRLRQSDSSPFSIEAHAAIPQTDWRWLTDYLRLDDDHAAALASFPDDEPMRAATAHCRGLRILRQEPWESLATFILSSTKQIVQIQQCVAHLCARYGEPLVAGRQADSEWFAFPTAERLAAASETELRQCKIGFRAKYLLDAARRVSSGQLNLAALPNLSLADARAKLMECHGVGRKIADCALLFSLGFDEAFPIDVWVERALRLLYFSKRRVKRARLERFAATHFGPHAGLAQQYLFHYLRTRDEP